MNTTERKIKAEEIINNELFIEVFDKIKKDSISSIKGLPWDAYGDAERRKISLKLDILDEISKQFEIERISDQALNVKDDK